MIARPMMFEITACVSIAKMYVFPLYMYFCMYDSIKSVRCLNEKIANLRKCDVNVFD